MKRSIMMGTLLSIAMSLAGAMTAAKAAPLVASPLAAPAGAGVTPVQYYGYRGYGYSGPRYSYGGPRYYGSYGYRGYDGYRRRHRGWNPGAAIVGGVAAAIIAGAIVQGRARDDDVERCAAEFRSFDPRSGTYVTYGGETRVCPYLR